MCTRALLTKLIILMIHNTCDSASRQIHLARLGNHNNECQETFIWTPLYMYNNIKLIKSQ